MLPSDGLLFPELHGARYGDGRKRLPLFLPKKLAQAARDLRLGGSSRDAARTILLKWADLESARRLVRMRETQLQAEFLTEVFGQALGYTLFSTGLAEWNLWPQFPVNSGTADAALGHFSDEQRTPRAVLELKGPKVNVDRDRSAGRTPVQQCWDYLNDLPECPWGIVCNYVSFRLYHRDKTPRAYEQFTLQDLRDEQRFLEFYYLFQHGGLLREIKGRPSRAEDLLAQSENRQREVGSELYRVYHEQRTALIAHLQRPPHGKSLDSAIHVAQKLLDRIVFIAFCKDRRLLPADAISHAASKPAPYSRVTNPLWQNFRNLFLSIDTGNERAGIPAFNGGLFARDPEVDDLELDDRWPGFFRDIGTYDFEFEVNVDVLGQLFEQSITDLENLRAGAGATEEAPAGRRATGRRKREGIYYTPPHITQYIVDYTLGATLAERCAPLARTHGVDPRQPPDDPPNPAWIAYHRAKLDVLRGLRVCDPACGSGAFLIQAYEFLEHEYEDTIANLNLSERDAERERDAVPDAILRENLFGVDLSEEAVELTRLALWIRTARAGKTLADLSHNILRGNSLVDDTQVDPHALDWSAVFPHVLPPGGFDCVVSNPPYVKLQNFRRRQPAVAAWLPGRYRAARTGNFDMYLPFIERGLGLLRPGGRMGLIAPSLWLFNEYGQGLRELIGENRALEQFVDFKSYQVFADATTYTALQFFSTTPHERIAAADASSGDLARLSFYSVDYPAQAAGAWALLADREQQVLGTMRAHSVPLTEAAGAIIVGLQTSADAVYHLTKLGSGRYYSRALGREVEIENEIMKPLVSGREAVPFTTPPTDKYILFPYLVTKNECRLYTSREMAKSFKRCWAYLGENEAVLRARESNKFDDDEWWRFGRHQSIDKQALPKLLVPRLLLHLFAAADAAGKVCIDNVDVGGIVVEDGWNLHYLLAILNSAACDFAWRLTSKPFRGEYRSANKQFIAPLPIPNTRDQKPVAALARELAKLHGRRLAAAAHVHRRFSTDLTPRELIAASPLPPALPQKVLNFDERPVGEVLEALADFAQHPLKPHERATWDEYITAETAALTGIKNTIRDRQAQLDGLVYALYGLSADQIRVIEESKETAS